MLTIQGLLLLSTLIQGILSVLSSLQPSFHETNIFVIFLSGISWLLDTPSRVADSSTLFD